MKKVFLLIAIFNTAIVAYSQNLIVAVQDFTARSGYSDEDLESITELFAGILLETGKVRVLTRNSSQWQSMLKEHSFQRNSGLVDPAEIRQLGRALGAKAVVTGTLGTLGSTNFLNTSILDVVSGEMLSTARKTFKDLDEFIDVVLPGLASDIVKLLVTSPLIGRWKVDGTSTVCMFNNDGTFEARQCSWYNNHKVIDRLISSTRGIKGQTIALKYEYYWASGTLRGTYSYTNTEVSVSCKFNGTVELWNAWGDGSGKNKIASETVNNFDMSDSFNYKFIDTNRMEIKDCVFLRGQIAFKGSLAGIDLNYYTRLTKVN